MAKTKISEWSTTPASNTDIDGINIAEGCAPSGINDAIRDLMSQVRSWQSGATGDPFAGPVTGSLSSATGLPISTGVSGLGTGVATALAVNVGSAGAPVVNGGALGTPSSGTVTNLTGTASININGTVGATTPTTGAFTTTSVSTSETLSYGTANGVTYLNGSKVLTSGSALTFDGTNLGVGTTSPSYKLEVYDATNPRLSLNTGASGTSELRFSTPSSGYQGLITYSAASNFMAFYTSAAEQMRLTSTGLGIGTSSPSARLHVKSADNTTASVIVENLNNTNGILQFGSASSSYQIFGGAYQGQMTYNTGAGTPHIFWIGGSEKLRLDGSGNLGLGVTPGSTSASGTFQMKSGGDMSFLGNGNISSNTYYNGTNYIYATTAASTRYRMASGQHEWYTAASGTAGNAITFTQAMTLDASGNLGVGTTSPTVRIQGYIPSVSSTKTEIFRLTDGVLCDFKVILDRQTTLGNSISRLNTASGIMAFETSDTERARIDSSGNLLVGTTVAPTSAGTSGVQITNSSSIGRINIGKNTTGAQYGMRFYYGATAVGDITYTDTATTFNSASDYRLKNVIGAVTGQGERIDALEPIEYEWKSNGSRTRGFLAHKFQEVYASSVTGEKDAVDEDGNPVYQAMQASTSEVIADLVAEIQSLRKRLADAGIA